MRFLWRLLRAHWRFRKRHPVSWAVWDVPTVQRVDPLAVADVSKSNSLSAPCKHHCPVRWQPIRCWNPLPDHICSWSLAVGFQIRLIFCFADLWRIIPLAAILLCVVPPPTRRQAVVGLRYVWGQSVVSSGSRRVARRRMHGDRVVSFAFTEHGIGRLVGKSCPVLHAAIFVCRGRQKTRQGRSGEVVAVGHGYTRLGTITVLNTSKSSPESRRRGCGGTFMR